MLSDSGIGVEHALFPPLPPGRTWGRNSAFWMSVTHTLGHRTECSVIGEGHGADRGVNALYRHMLAQTPNLGVYVYDWNMILLISLPK